MIWLPQTNTQRVTTPSRNILRIPGKVEKSPPKSLDFLKLYLYTFSKIECLLACVFMVRQNIFVKGGEFYGQCTQSSYTSSVSRRNSSRQRFASIVDLSVLKRMNVQFAIDLRNFFRLKNSSYCLEFHPINSVQLSSA